MAISLLRDRCFSDNDEFREGLPSRGDIGGVFLHRRSPAQIYGPIWLPFLCVAPFLLLIFWSSRKNIGLTLRKIRNAQHKRHSPCCLLRSCHCFLGKKKCGEKEMIKQNKVTSELSTCATKTTGPIATINEPSHQRNKQVYHHSSSG